jgi:hypothetical protein
MILRFSRLAAAGALLIAASLSMYAQGRGGGRGAAGPPPSGRAGAPYDITGYWVSLIVDEWRFRVTPQKGDIVYLPLNAEARRVAGAWDPDKDEAEGNACKAYGAVGVMQRPGRLHMTWQDDNTLKMEADSGSQTRLFHFGSTAPAKGAPSWQGDSVAQWQVMQGRGGAALDLGGLGFVQGNGPTQGARGGTLKVTTTNMKPGYIRKNGVPYSGNAVLTEYMNLLMGANNEPYFIVTASVEDPAYLTGPFLRTYTFKKQADASGWEPTPCWPK